MRALTTNRLLVSCSSLGSEPRDPNMSRFLTASLAAFFLAVATEFTLAQEAVSTTSGSGATSSTTAPSSASAPTTTESSNTTTTLSEAASSTGAPPLETAPSGVGVFTPTPVKIYATLLGGYDDNVGTSRTSKQGSAFTAGNVILDYTFGDPRLQIILNGGAGGVYYYKQVGGQNYDIDLKGALGVTFKASPRLTLGATVLVEYLTEPSFDAPGGLNSRNGNYFYTTDKFFVSYLWARRFSTKTSYTLEAFNYDNSAFGAFSDRVTNTFGNEFLFQLVPTTALVAEYRLAIVSYDMNSLDSTTHFALGGIDHQFNPRLSASLRGGAEFRSYDQDGDRTSPYVEGLVTYALGKRTSVSWNSRYGIEEADLPGFQSRTTFRTGVRTKFSLTSRVSTTVDFYYVHDNYNSLSSAVPPSPGFSEDGFDGNLSASYAINPLFGLQVGYHYTNISSDVVFREYSRNRAFAGVSLTF